MKGTDEIIAYFEGVLLQFLTIDDLQHRTTLRTNDRVSSERIKMDAFGKALCNCRRGYHRSQRGTVSDPFRHGYDVRDHTLAFKSPIGLAGTAETGLHFVSDADTASGSHMLIDMLEIAIREHHGPTDSLN